MPKQILNSIISETTKIITWSETKVGRQFRCWTCVQTSKKANLEEEKYQMKSHPALNIELKKKKKKLVKLKWPEVENWNRKSKKLVKLKWPEVENWNRKSETTNWLRLRSHHTSVQKLSAILCRFVHTRWKFIQIQTQQVRNFSHFSAIRCCPPTI